MLWKAFVDTMHRIYWFNWHVIYIYCKRGHGSSSFWRMNEDNYLSIVSVFVLPVHYHSMWTFCLCHALSADNIWRVSVAHRYLVLLLFHYSYNFWFFLPLCTHHTTRRYHRYSSTAHFVYCWIRSLLPALTVDWKIKK